MINTLEQAALPVVQTPPYDRFWQMLEEHSGLRRLFLTLCICLWGVVGGLLCLLACGVLAMVPKWDWLLCAVGYPALCFGLWGGVIALYRHTDPKS